MDLKTFKQILSLAEEVENVEFDSQVKDIEDEFVKIVNTFKKDKETTNEAKPCLHDKDEIFIKTATSCSEEEDPKLDEDNHKYKIIISVELPIELEEYHIDDITELVEDYLADEIFDDSLDINEEDED